jgi:hypothetical protein
VTASRSLAANHPDYLVLLSPARGSARCWCRSTGGSRCPSRCFILNRRFGEALVVEEAFAAVVPPPNRALPDARIIGFDFAPGDKAPWRPVRRRAASPP